MSSKQTAAAVALARGASVAEAAKAAGVDSRTVVRWRTLPEFTEAVQTIVADAFADTVAVLSHSSADAARYLTDVAAGRVECDGGRVNACRLVLTIGPSFRDHVEFAAQLLELERAIEEGNNHADAK